jgi:hypothetical protein
MGNVEMSPELQNLVGHFYILAMHGLAPAATH